MTQPAAQTRGDDPRRALTLPDAIGVGVAAMVGAGLFVAFGPATAAAGKLLPLALGVAALVAVANAHASARLATRYPEAGGAYAYGRERLGVPWGHLAGWAFIVGTTASCSAMALTIGVHVWPENAKAIAIVVVLAVLGLNLYRVQRSARAARLIALAVLVLVLVFVAVMLLAPPATTDEPVRRLPDAGGWHGVLQGAGFLFFAFVGYDRVTTVAAEVRRPGRTIPWAIGLALALVLGLYALVAAVLTDSLGEGWVAARDAPLADAAAVSTWPWLGPVLRIAAVILVGGALLTLFLGVSRTVLALARDEHLPPYLATIDPRHGVPRHAEILIAGMIIIAVLVGSLAGLIGLAAFSLLVYCGVADLSALTLPGSVLGRLVSLLGLLGCLVVALLLPWPIVATGIVVLAMGAFIGWARHTTRE
ncbi:APC family permease [Janibacter corallicola]|uniref:APC family permease n=1 Tax=Janibacter corallicola TaxID=415212 RepID=UPI000829CD50|nr:APC family permease [Janibacter corallicola]